jgi:hypothetical protein
VRIWSESFSPVFSEHLIDWFHITMRLTVLQQQTKALQEERPQTGAEVSKRLESVKHLLWHGNTEEALERLGDLLVMLSFIQAHSNAAKKVADGLSEFETYICNNREFIPNFGERRRQGETISTTFVESTINQVVSRRFVRPVRTTDRAIQRDHWFGVVPRGASWPALDDQMRAPT